MLRRRRQRAPNLGACQRLVLGFWSLFLNPQRILSSAVIVKPYPAPLPRGPQGMQIPGAIFSVPSAQAWSKRSSIRNDPCDRRTKTAQPTLWKPANCPAVGKRFRDPTQQRFRQAGFGSALPTCGLTKWPTPRPEPTNQLLELHMAVALQWAF